MGFVFAGELFEESVETTVVCVADLVAVMLSMLLFVESFPDERVVSTSMCKYYLIKFVLLALNVLIIPMYTRSLWFQIYYLGSPYLHTVQF